MASGANDIVTLERMKTELRIPATITDHDLIIEGQIKSAISWVSEATGHPLIDITKKIYDCPYGASPILISTHFAKSLSGIKYWDSDGSLNAGPNATLTGSYLTNRILGIASVYPPDEGWPDILAGSLFEITLIEGYDITSESEALEHGVILLVRDLYTGVRDERTDSIIYSIIDPFIRYTYRTAEGLIEPGAVVIPETSVTPSVPVMTLTDNVFFGTSTDEIPESAELNVEGTGGVGTVLAYTGSMHLLIARLESEPDISRVLFSGDSSHTNQIGGLTKYSTTVIPTGETDPYNVWVSNQSLTQSDDQIITVD